MAKAPLHSTGDASRLDCVARRSHISNMLAPRALPAGRLTGLGATRGFTTDSWDPPEPHRRLCTGRSASDISLLQAHDGRAREFPQPATARISVASLPRFPSSRKSVRPARRMTEPAEAALSCTGLVKRYGNVLAVDGLDLEVRRGECCGLLGPNGAGQDHDHRDPGGAARAGCRTRAGPGARVGRGRRRAAGAAQDSPPEMVANLHTTAELNAPLSRRAGGRGRLANPDGFPPRRSARRRTAFPRAGRSSCRTVPAPAGQRCRAFHPSSCRGH